MSLPAPIVGLQFGNAGVQARYWAPAASSLAVVIEDRTVRLEGPDDQGYFTGTLRDASPGTRYWLQVDESDRFPDPFSRSQPDGPFGPSELVDSRAFGWGDADWHGPSRTAGVVYELHVGTFTPEGTYAAASTHLPALADLGITTIEILPVAEFPGRFGWGYDGVQLFAPSHLYGTPDDLRRFIDTAHQLGVAVVLDVVYNHVGPDGNFLRRLSPDYFRATATEWGDGFSLDAPTSAPVREVIRANVRYWIEAFHFDGLRLDAIQAIVDTSSPHIVTEIAREVRAAAAGRRTWIVGEDETQHATLVRPEPDGMGIDALWNDDFHHAAIVALTDRHEAYYSDYRGTPQEFVAAVERGFLFQGQRYSWQKNPRGTWAMDLPAAAFVAFLQNHDQVANSLTGARLDRLTSPGRLRAMTALLLLGPWTPMLFQGQEFRASAPFHYFADHKPDLNAMIRQGRVTFLSQFPTWASTAHARMLDPASPDTFHMSVVDHRERESHEDAWTLHASLIARRHGDVAFLDRARFGVRAAVIGPHTFLLRWCGARPSSDDRLLMINLGPAERLPFIPDPLVSPYPERTWHTIWSTDDPEVGGRGRVDVAVSDGWFLPAESATLLAPGESA